MCLEAVVDLDLAALLVKMLVAMIFQFVRDMERLVTVIKMASNVHMLRLSNIKVGRVNANGAASGHDPVATASKLQNMELRSNVHSLACQRDKRRSGAVYVT